MNEMEDGKPPSTTEDSEGDCGSGRYYRAGIGDLHWIPIWRGGNLSGLAAHMPIGYHRLQFNKTMDLRHGAVD